MMKPASRFSKVCMTSVNEKDLDSGATDAVGSRRLRQAVVQRLERLQQVELVVHAVPRHGVAGAGATFERVAAAAPAEDGVPTLLLTGPPG